MSTPIYRIVADETDITGVLRDRVISMSITEAAGMESDTFQMDIDDSDAAIALPRTGAVLTVAMGYAEGPVMATGSFTVDEISLSGPPSRLSIRGRAADLRREFKAQKTRPWHDTTLGEVVNQIAQENGYQARISPALARVPIAHEDQTTESDLNLLTRLARRHDATCKPSGGFLVFVLRGTGKSAGGSALPRLSLSPEAVRQWSVNLTDRSRYHAVKARYHDPQAGRQKTVIAGSGDPAFTLRHTYASQGDAARAARAKLSELRRGSSTVSLTLPGRPELSAEGQIDLVGFRTGIDGPWSITRVEHRLESGGFTSQLEAEIPSDDEPVGVTSETGEAIELDDLEVDLL